MYNIKPKKFIKNKEGLENFECRICYEISEKPQMCLGPCKIILCPCCITSIDKNIGGCPQRCSKPLRVQVIEGLNIQFDCPWNKELCKQVLKTPEQFLDHISKCEFVSPDWNNVIHNMSHYLCEKGHNMLFLDEDLLKQLYGYDFYATAINSVCSHCEVVGLCRTICPTCSTKEKLVLFCTKCSKPPCIKTSCPYSHSFVQDIAYSNSNICDMCGKPSRMFGTHVYRDTACNFDICQVCYENLPAEHPLVPFERDESMLVHLLPKQNHHQNFLHMYMQNQNLLQFQLDSNNDSGSEGDYNLPNQPVENLLLIEHEDNLVIQDSDDEQVDNNNEAPAGL